MNCIGSDEQHRVGTIITTQVVCLAIYIQFAIFIRVCVMGKVQFNVHKHNALDATFARYILDCGLGFYLPYFSTFHAWWRSDILNCSIMLHNVCDWIAYVANNACVVLAFVACCIRTYPTRHGLLTSQSKLLARPPTVVFAINVDNG